MSKPSVNAIVAIRALRGLDITVTEYCLTGHIEELMAACSYASRVTTHLYRERAKRSQGKEVNQMKKACKAKPMSMPKSAKAEMKEEKSEKKAMKKGKY